MDIRGRLFSAMNGHGPIDHLVGSCKQHRPYREAKRLRSLEIAGPERFENGPALRPPLGLNVRAPRRDVVGFSNLGRACPPAVLKSRA